MIEFRDVSLNYGGHTVLSMLNFRLPPHAFVTVVGPSGAGKTSLLRLLATYQRPTRGEIVVGGYALSRLSRRGRAHFRRSVGYIGADVELLPQRSCYDNIALPLRILGMSEREVKGRVYAALARVGLEAAAHVRPEVLSGGEQKRIAVARAVVGKPSLLLVDEPTAELDELAAAEVIQLLGEFNEAGVTVVFATHDALLPLSVSHRVRIEQGQVAVEVL